MGPNTYSQGIWKTRVRPFIGSITPFIWIGSGSHLRGLGDPGCQQISGKLSKNMLLLESKYLTDMMNTLYIP